MSLHAALAAAATLVAVAFSLSTFERWLDRRRRHELAWTVALAMFAAGAAALFTGASLGWSGPVFRIFYFFGAIANVPFLALGTVYLLAGRRAGDRTAVVVTLAVAFAGGVLVAAPLTAPMETAALPRGSEVFGPLPRLLAAVASGTGATVVFLGAAWSAGRLLVGRRARPGVPPGAPLGRLAAGNVLIALGTAVLSVSGLLNSMLGAMDAFAVTLVAGVTLIFAGSLVARTPAPAAERADPDHPVDRPLAAVR
jgi:hypothetical protein